MSRRCSQTVHISQARKRYSKNKKHIFKERNNIFYESLEYALSFKINCIHKIPVIPINQKWNYYRPHYQKSKGFYVGVLFK